MSSEYRYRPGQIVPGTDLKIIMPIGSGGMGSVYEVEETSVEAPFVMKVIHPELLRDNAEHVRERMRREAKTLAQLSHKHIVRVYRAGLTTESPPLPFYVMDMLSGHTLSQIVHSYVSKGRLPPLGLFFQVAKSLLSALDYAHKRGVVHRDVKPANIFMHRPEGEEPILKLLDFGIMATVAEMSEKARLTGDRFAGTYTHAAPEQLQGDKPTPAMDIYAAGLVLYEMLTGVHPFEDCEHPASWIHAHANKAPAPVVWKRPVPPELDKLVLAMMAKDPLDRPKPAGAIVGTLETIEAEWRAREPAVFTVKHEELSSQADLGKPMPTNMGSSLFDEWLQRDPTPASSAPSGRLEEKMPVGTHSTWGGTLASRAHRVSVGSVLVAAVGFSLVTVAIAWTLQSSHQEPAVTKAAPTEIVTGAAPVTVAPAALPSPPPETATPPAAPVPEPVPSIEAAPPPAPLPAPLQAPLASPAVTPNPTKRPRPAAPRPLKTAPATAAPAAPAPARSPTPAPAATPPPSLLEP